MSISNQFNVDNDHLFSITDTFLQEMAEGPYGKTTDIRWL